MVKVDFHPTSASQSPKYNGKAKYESTKIENKTDDNNYTIVKIGLNSNNRKMQTTRSVFENGKLVKEGVDFDGDNIPDCIDDYEYDERGNLTAWKQDINGDGETDRVSRYLYDVNNNLIQFGTDEDMDGVADNMAYLEYDENGNITKYSVDLDNDGVADKVEKKQYDDNNNCTQTLIDKDNDGIFDEEYNYIYESGIKTATEANFYFKNGHTAGYVAIYDNDGNIISKTMK